MSKLNNIIKSKLDIFTSIDNEVNKLYNVSTKQKPQDPKSKLIENLISKETYDDLCLGSNPKSVKETKPIDNYDSSSFNNIYFNNRSNKSPYAENISVNNSIDFKKKLNKSINSKSDSLTYSEFKKSVSSTLNNKAVSLYEDSKRVKYNKKLYESSSVKKQKEESIPKISKMAKEIVRDPFFEERLYPYHKICQYDSKHSFNNQINKENEYSYNDNVYRKSRKHSTDKSNLSFSPILNSKSLQIAKQLEPSFIRLTSKSRSKSKHNLNNSPSLNKTYSKTKILSPGHRLYSQGIEKIKERKLLQKSIEETSKTEETFIRPVYTPTAKDLEAYNQFYMKSSNWKKIIKNKVEATRNFEEKILNKECSFSPYISKSFIKPDDVNIKRNIKQIYSYVSKRREFLNAKSREKEKSEGKNKVFIVNKNHQFTFTPSPNIEFEMEKRIDIRNSGKNSSNSKKDIGFYRYLTGSENFYQ